MMGPEIIYVAENQHAIRGTQLWKMANSLNA
jgi:hypothetical protein